MCLCNRHANTLDLKVELNSPVVLIEVHELSNDGSGNVLTMLIVPRKNFTYKTNMQKVLGAKNVTWTSA